MREPETIQVSKQYGNHAVAWSRFLHGHWTRERPTKPGIYPIEGVGCGSPEGTIPNTTVGVAKLGDALIYTQEWKGWWWSEPFPMLPPPPDAVETSRGLK